MPTNRKEYMRQYMADKRAKDRARGTVEKTSPHDVKGATPQPQAPQQVAPTAAERWAGGLHDLTATATGFPDGTVELHGGAAPKSYRSLPFLSAPDDDCAACGHDRQAYHLPAELPCRGPAPMARGGVCRCPAFVDSGDPF